MISRPEIIDYLTRNLYSENGIHINVFSTFRVYSGDLQGYINKNTDQIFKIYKNPFCFEFLNFMYKLYVSFEASGTHDKFLSFHNVRKSWNSKTTVNQEYFQFLLKDIFLVIRTDLSTVKKSYQLGKNSLQLGKKNYQSRTKNNYVVSDGDLLLQLETRKKEIKTELSFLQEQLTELEKEEVFNEKTQIGETEYGLALGFIEIELIDLENVRIGDDEICNVIISVCPKAGNQKISEPAEKSEEKLVFNHQTFQFAPIKTHDAQILINVFKQIPEQDNSISILGSVRVDVREFASQETQLFSKNLMGKTYDSISSKDYATRLNFNARFQYSKIVRLETKIVVLTDELQSIENEIALLKSRKPHLSQELTRSQKHSKFQGNTSC